MLVISKMWLPRKVDSLNMNREKLAVHISNMIVRVFARFQSGRRGKLADYNAQILIART